MARCDKKGGKNVIQKKGGGGRGEKEEEEEAREHKRMKKKKEEGDEVLCRLSGVSNDDCNPVYPFARRLEKLAEETVSFVHKRGRRVSARAFTGGGEKKKEKTRRENVAERVYIYSA